MLKQLFGTRATTKADVAIGIVAVVVAAVKAVDNVKQYKARQSETINEENKS